MGGQSARLPILAQDRRVTYRQYRGAEEDGEPALCLPCYAGTATCDLSLTLRHVHTLFEILQPHLAYRRNDK